MSFTPAADMQRTIHRLKALPAMISAYSNSESSALASETRCSEETIFVGLRDMAGARNGGLESWRECTTPQQAAALAKTLIDNL
jgi:hypothetical protein